MTTLKSLACSIIFRGIPLLNYDITIWIHLGDSTWFNPGRSAEFVQDSRRSCSTIKMQTIWCAGYVENRGPNHSDLKQQTSHQLSAILPSELSWFKQAKGTSSMLWCVASAWSPRKTFEKMFNGPNFGENQHLPSGSSSYMLFHVKCI